MVKRSQSLTEDIHSSNDKEGIISKKAHQENNITDTPLGNDEEIGEFEDAWEDDIEEEEVIMANSSDDDDDNHQIMDQDMEPESSKKRVYLPGEKLNEGEVLDYDRRAYRMYHKMGSEWPCLSFDVVHDALGDNRSQYPQTMYLVSGSQASESSKNRIYMMKVSNLYRTFKGAAENTESDDDTDDDTDDELDEDPVLEHKSIPHRGGINRVKMMPGKEFKICATWSEEGNVGLWDLENAFKSLNNPGYRGNSNIPIHMIENHSTEGFALGWSRLASGRLATGDCNGEIYLTQNRESEWTTEPQPFKSHNSSVEDIQWSPTQDNVFSSCSVDGSIRFWDTRLGRKSQLTIDAHKTDVNVITWSQKLAYLLASGADDGGFKIWDLRMAKSSKPSASYDWHKSPVTSIEWCPTDESVLAVSGADNQLSLWDFSVEADDEAMKGAKSLDVPPQLMFIHQGQNDIKEIHWHPQIPGTLVSTSESGFDIFKAISMD